MTAQARRFSNRRLLRQMEAWGWVRTGHLKGSTVLMAHPLAGIEVEVKAAHVHASNHPDQVCLVYEATTGGDVDRFWAGPPAKTVTPLLDRALQTGHHDAGPHFESTDSQPTETEEVTVPEPDREPNVRGIARAVFRQMLRHSGRNIAQVAKSTNLDGRSVGRALAYLTSLGLTERLGSGIYRVAEDVERFLATNPAVIDETNLDALALMVRQTAPAEVAPEPSLAPEEVKVTASADLDDETLYGVLDLLLPGRSFTVRDLPAIDRWKACTLDLLKSLS